MSFRLSVWSLFSFLQEITDPDLILTWGILLISNTFLSIFWWNFSDVFLCWALCLPMSQWWAQSMFLAKCLPMSLPNLSTGAVWCFSIFSFNICLVVLRRSVWAGSRFLRCLSDENLANVFSGLSSVSVNIFLVSSVDVLPKCLPVSAAKSVSRSHLMSSRINPQSFFQYLSNGLMCSIWAGSQLCLPISSWWESC